MSLREKIESVIRSGEYSDGELPDVILALIRSEIERAGEVEVDPHNYTNPDEVRIGIAEQQGRILRIFDGTAGQLRRNNSR